jgi:hypothetical protein
MFQVILNFDYVDLAKLVVEVSVPEIFGFYVQQLLKQLEDLQERCLQWEYCT